MLIRTLIACSFLVGPVIAQEQAPQPPPEKKADPPILRFMGRQNFFAQKKPAPSSVSIEKELPSKVCSIPLTNVTPPAIPYMPSFKPPANTRSMSIAPPAPPCADKRGAVKRPEAP